MHYLLHHIHAQPRQWQAAAESLVHEASALGPAGGGLFGVWRAQIGRPRDELTVITTWPDSGTGGHVMASLLEGLAEVVTHEHRWMRATLRPESPAPPDRQGNYAFREFATPAVHWEEFLSLCASAWPGFESAYDSQVIGLWRFDDPAPDPVRSLLLTRRPDLAAWERSKLPQGDDEAEVRRLLSRRYDLCDHTVVCTATLFTASDRVDTARWT
jgi:hypothetical protein